MTIATTPFTAAYQLVPLKLLAESPLNHRKHFDKDKLAELAESIRKHGVLQPALARPAGKAFELVFGHRRFRAAAQAGLDAMPVIVREMSDKEVLEAQVIENVQREDVHPLEEAEGYRALTETHGMTVDELAAKIGKSKSYIYSRLKLCALTKNAKKAFQENQISAAIAYLVARLPADQQDQAVGEMLRELKYNGAMTFEEASEFIQQHYMLQLGNAPFDTASVDLVPKAGACTTCPKRTGNQKDLFADVKSKDVCTDKGCFTAKREASTARQVKKAEAAGKVVLSGEKAKKALSYGSEYVRLDETAHEDPKYRTYSQLLGKKVDPVLVIDERGAAHSVLPKSEIPKLLKAAGHNFKARSSGGGSDHEFKARQKKANLLREVARRGMGLLVTYLTSKEPSEAMWRAVASATLRNAGADTLGHVLKRRELPSKGVGWDKSAPVLKSTKDMDVTGLRAIIFEAALSQGAYPGPYSASLGREFSSACEAAGINLAKLTKEVQAEKKPTKAKQPAAKKAG